MPTKSFLQRSGLTSFFQSFCRSMGQLNWLLFLALIVALPYNRYIIQPLWVAWFVAWVLEFRWLHPRTSSLHRPSATFTDFAHLIPALGIAFFVLWEIVSVAWAADSSLVWNSVERHVSFLILPMVLWVGFNEHYDWQRVLRAFIYGAVVSVLVYAFTRFWVNNYTFAFHWNTEIHPFRPFNMVDMTLTMKHRLFYCMDLTMALVFLGYQWRYFMQRLQPMVGVLCVGSLAFLLLWGIWATSSRQSLLTLAALAFVAIVLTIFRWTSKMTSKKRFCVRIGGALALILVLALVLVLLVKFHPRFSQLQKSYFTEYEQHVNDEKFEPRIAIWHVIWESRDAYPVYGLGAGQSTVFLKERYQERGWVNYAFHELRAHNQYFQVWMELGIVAVLALIILLVLTPWCYGAKTRPLAAYGVALLMLSMTTDTVFGVIEGIIFTCVLFLILYLHHCSLCVSSLSQVAEDAPRIR